MSSPAAARSPPVQTQRSLGRLSTRTCTMEPQMLYAREYHQSSCTCSLPGLRHLPNMHWPAALVTVPADAGNNSPVVWKQGDALAAPNSCNNIPTRNALQHPAARGGAHRRVRHEVIPGHFQVQQLVFESAVLPLALQRAVPVVLHCVVGPARQALGDLRPLVAGFLQQGEKPGTCERESHHVQSTRWSPSQE